MSKTASTDVRYPDDTPTSYTFSVACIYGDYDQINHLMSICDNVDYNYGLFAACWGGYYKLAELMLDKGADPQYQFGVSLLSASERGHVNIVKLLLERWEFSPGSLTKALARAEGRKHDNVAKILHENGARYPEHI